MAEELSDYEYYNTLNKQVAGPKPKVVKPKTNEFEALRQKGVETSISGRNENTKPQSFMGSHDDPSTIVAGQNINESRAFNQSATENLFSGLTKGTGLLGTTIANTFVGLPLGIAEASYSGLATDDTKSEAISKVYDNEVTRNLEKFNQNMEKWFPNYYSEKEQKADAFSWNNLSSSNFWGDKVLKNTGFTAGAILGGGIVSKGIRGSAWLAKALVGANELTEGALLAQFNTLVADGMDGALAAKKIATGVRALNNSAALATSTIVSAGEASSEALQAKTETKKMLDEQWKSQNPNSQLDEATEALHEQLASKAGNATMATNMALLMGTETFQFGKLWAKGFTPELKRVANLGLKDGAVEVIKPSFKKKIASMIASGASNSLAESFEEGTQTATQAAAKDYYGRLYDKDAISESSRATHAVLAGLQETFGTKDGIESMLLGAITGLGSHAATSGVSKLIGKMQNIPTDDARAEVFSKQMNQQFSKQIPFLKANIRAASINQSIQDNANSTTPSRVVHENLSHDNLKALVQPFIEADRFDLLEDKLNNELMKDDEEFKADHPDVDTKKTSKDYVSKIIKDAKRLKENWENIDEVFPKASPVIKERLWSLLSDIQNKDERAKSLNLQQFAKTGINYDGLSDYVSKIQDSYNSGNIEANPQVANDIVELDSQKKQATEEYKQLTNPEVQKTVVEEDNKRQEEIVAMPVNESGQISSKEELQATQTSNPTTSTTEPEISSPEASNELEEVSNEQQMASDLIETIKSKQHKLKDVLAYLKQEAEDPDNDSASVNEVIRLVTDHFTPKKESKAEAKPEVKNPESTPSEKLGIENPIPTIVDNDAHQNEYSELDRMSATGYRTTANHQEAIDLGLNSVLRYQNFINNPNNNILASNYRLMVVTPSSSLYNKIQNKKQREFEANRKSEGKEVNGIYAVIVDTNNNLITTDAGGNILDSTIEPGEYDDNVDNLESGILVTTLVSNPETKESGYNAVSYQNFGRSRGFEDNVDEATIKDETTPVGKAWKEHKEAITKVRTGILSGKVKYLKITGFSHGIYQNTNSSNNVGQTLGVDINSPELTYYIAKVEDISNPGYTEIGEKEGLNHKQNIKVGKPYLIYNGRLYPLKTNKLDANTAIAIGAQLDNIDVKDIEATKKTLKQVGRVVYLPSSTIDSILNSELAGDNLVEYLQTRYRQVDAGDLTDRTKRGNEYREKVLGGDNPVITMNFNPHPTSPKDAPNFMNAYFTYEAIAPLDNAIQNIEKAKEVTPEKIAEEAPKKAAGRTRKKVEVEDGDVLLRRARPTISKTEDISATKKWFESRFNGESFEVVDDLINGNAFGEYTAAATRLYAGAEEGTAYHEAFHKVTQEYLTAKQVASLYDAVRKSYPKFSDLEAEEWLAEEFRNFVLSGQKAIKNMPYTNNIFRKLYNWIKSLVTGTITPQQVFDKLASSKGYTGAKKFNNQQFTRLDRSSIPGLTHEQTKNIVDSINAHFFNTLFASNKTPDEILGDREIVDKIYSAVYKRIIKYDYNQLLEDEDTYSPQEFEAIMQHYDFLLNIDEDGNPTSLNTEAIKAHRQYLKNNGIELSDNVGNAEEEEDRLAREDDSEEVMQDDSSGRDKAEWKASNEESPFNSTPSSVKMLVMSLADTNADGEEIANSIGGPSLNNYAKTMSLLYSNLNGLVDFSDMYDKLESLSSRFPVFKQLINRLGKAGEAKTLQQQLLENDFRQAFSKFESRGTVTLINQETSKIYQVDANANKLRDKIKENWNSNLRAKANDSSSYITKNEEGVITISPSFITDAKAGKFKDNYKALLSELGIEFTDLTQSQVQDIDGIRDIANTIFKYVAKTINDGKPVNDLFSKDVDIRGQINKLLTIEQKYSKETIELSYISAEGKRIYAVSLNNYYSLVVNALNNSTTKDELFRNYPHLNNPYTQNSQWIKALFDSDGNKIAGRVVYMNTVSGLKIEGQNDSGVGATKMEPADKIVQEINDLLGKGTTSLIRAADKSSEYALGVTGYDTGYLLVDLDSIPDKGLDTPEIRAIFSAYFDDELAIIRAFLGEDKVGANIDIYNRQASNFRLFADILSSETLSELEPYKKTTDSIPAPLRAKIESETVAYLAKYAKEVKDYLQARKIGIKTKNGFTGISSEFTDNTEQGLNKAIKAFAVNHLIQMQEQAKLFIGDSAFYKDKFKRISAGTGTKKFAANSKLQNNWLNSFYKNSPRVDNKAADGRVRTVIFGDVKAQQENLDEYITSLVESGKSEEEAKAILDAYTKMDEGDAQGWITLDEYREFMIRVGGAYWTKQHEAQYQYEKALENGNTSIENPHFYFMPIKAQHFGPQLADNIYAPAFHKYSLAPLIPSLVKGRNMEKLLDSMRKNQIGYALFGSGSKVGTPLGKDGKLPSFYNGSGELAGVDSAPVQEIYYENLGIQLDIAPKVKDKLIFGSQFRKLIFSNLFGENMKPEFKALADEYNGIINKLVNDELDKLTKKLGLKVTKNNTGEYESFTFNGDYTKLVSQLKQQLDDKDTADNILDSLQTNEDGSLKYPIDGLVNRPKIESMLFSIVNNKVIKQKTLGNSLVQLASSGFESAGARKVGESNYLKFYRKDENGRTLPMEVEIPMNKTFAPLLKKYGSIEALNKAIEEDKVDQKHLLMVGYRIPTQGLNSMDFMTIKRFMPEASGIAIILPTGVVAKSGGDYDIDKLNIFMPHIADFKEEGREFAKTSKEAMQNRIVSIASEVLSHPDNFNDLITPNTTDTLLDLVANIRKAQGKGKVEKASMTKEFRFDWIMEQFTYFLGGKAGVGIGAVHNTHHILSQIAKVKLNVDIPFKHNRSGDQADLSKQYTQGGQKISDIISQFINAYVDVAKDPFYKDLNAGTEVAGVWFYLLRAGVDVNTVGYFMTQPIIKEYVEARKLNNSLVNKSSGRQQANGKVDLSERGRAKIAYKMETNGDPEYVKRWQSVLDNGSVYNDILDKYGVDYKTPKADFTSDTINDTLIKYIKEGVGGNYSTSFRIAQTQLLEAFVKFENESSELTSLMGVTNQDTTKMQNFGSVEQKNRKIAEVNESEVVPVGTRENILSSTIVGSFDKGRTFSNMYSELTLFMNKPEIYKAIKPLIDNLYADKKADFNKGYVAIQNDIIGYITQKFGKTIEGESLVSKMSLLSGDASLAKQLVALRKEGLEDINNNQFISELVAQISADGKLDTIKLWSRRMNAFESNVMTEAFREVLESNNPKISAFGRDLVYATILQSGLHNSPITFTELIPFEFYGNLVDSAIKNSEGKLNPEAMSEAIKLKQLTTSKIQDYGIQPDSITDITSSVDNEASDTSINEEDNNDYSVDNPLGNITLLEPWEEGYEEEQSRVKESWKTFNPSRQHSAMKDANKNAEISEEDGETTKQCNV